MTLLPSKLNTEPANDYVCEEKSRKQTEESRQNIWKLYELRFFFKLLLLLKTDLNFDQQFQIYLFPYLLQSIQRFQVLSMPWGWWFFSPKDSITTKDLSTVSNSAGSFLKGPVLCVVRQGKITKKGAAFICREWGEDDFLGGREMFVFFGGQILGSWKSSWDIHGTKRVWNMFCFSTGWWNKTTQSWDLLNNMFSSSSTE